MNNCPCILFTHEYEPEGARKGSKQLYLHTPKNRIFCPKMAKKCHFSPKTVFLGPEWAVVWIPIPSLRVLESKERVLQVFRATY